MTIAKFYDQLADILGSGQGETWSEWHSKEVNKLVKKAKLPLREIDIFWKGFCADAVIVEEGWDLATLAGIKRALYGVDAKLVIS